MSRTLGIVPARAGSKRLVDKNLRPVGGKPLALRAIETALATRRISRLVVSSDDRRVLDIADAVDPSIALERPSELATDTAMAVEYVRHALGAMRAQGEEPFDGVVIVQPTSPFTTAEDIDATVALLDDRSIETAVTVMPLDHALQPAKLKTMEEGGVLRSYLAEENGRMAAHQLPALFVRNGSVYATRVAVIDRGEIIGEPCVGHVMSRQRSVDINDEFDLAFAEFLWGRKA